MIVIKYVYMCVIEVSAILFSMYSDFCILNTSTRFKNSVVDSVDKVGTQL